MTRPAGLRTKVQHLAGRAGGSAELVARPAHDLPGLCHAEQSKSEKSPDQERLLAFLWAGVSAGG
jgi:hypothetical protein